MSGRRVVVAVTPRLLADVLDRALTLDGFQVSLAESGDAEEYDVAVVSPGREHEVRAGRILTLDADSTDLAALRALLQRAVD